MFFILHATKDYSLVLVGNKWAQKKSFVCKPILCYNKSIAPPSHQLEKEKMADRGKASAVFDKLTLREAVVCCSTHTQDLTLEDLSKHNFYKLGQVWIWIKNKQAEWNRKKLTN